MPGTTGSRRLGRARLAGLDLYGEVLPALLARRAAADAILLDGVLLPAIRVWTLDCNRHTPLCGLCYGRSSSYHHVTSRCQAHQSTITARKPAELSEPYFCIRVSRAFWGNRPNQRPGATTFAGRELAWFRNGDRHLGKPHFLRQMQTFASEPVPVSEPCRIMRNGFRSTSCRSWPFGKTCPGASLPVAYHDKIREWGGGVAVATTAVEK